MAQGLMVEHQPIHMIDIDGIMELYSLMEAKKQEIIEHREREGDERGKMELFDQYMELRDQYERGIMERYDQHEDPYNQYENLYDQMELYYLMKTKQQAFFEHLEREGNYFNACRACGVPFDQYHELRKTYNRGAIKSNFWNSHFETVTYIMQDTGTIDWNYDASI